MSRRARMLLVVGVGSLVPASTAAQGVWVGHQAPCELNTGHYLVKGSILHLKLGVESQFEDARVSRQREAIKVLHEAILEKGQADNAAAWYYLGRAYALGLDFAGADSAFRRAVELAPVCAPDVDEHRARLAAFAMNDALRTWGAGAADSAVDFFRQARALDTTDAEIPLYASLMFASQQQPDSAAAYLQFGLRAAETDTAHGERLRQAALEVARAYETRAMTDVPAARTAAQSRVARDTTLQQIARDSALLARITADVNAMREGGGRLTPQARASFERDSSLLESRLEAGRAARDSLVRQAARDSVAAAEALAPAIAAYREFLNREPDDADAAMQLLRLVATTGDRNGLDALVDQVVASPSVGGAALAQAALSLYSDGFLGPAARLVGSALARNPADHGALNIGTYVYHALGDTTRLSDVAERRLALAPLDPAAARANALAWDLRGNADSARAWVAVADTGLAWNVHVSQFQATEHGSGVNGYVRNAVPRALPAMVLVFEFLDASGTVLGSMTAEIPALDVRGRAPLAVRIEQGGAASWRYRRQ